LKHLPECFGYTAEKWTARKYHYKWNITEKEVQNELDRQLKDKVSFVFVLNWL